MLNRKGQNIAEYSILIALVIAAAVAMQTYVKRGIQGRVVDAVDFAGPDVTIEGETLSFTTKQYEPYYLDSAADVTSTRSYRETIAERGDISRTAVSEDTRRKRGAWEEQIYKGETAR